MILKDGWHYKNTILVILGTIVAFVMSQSNGMHEFLMHLGTWGYVGGFVGGILFVSSFTAGIGTVILILLSESLPIFPLSVVAGLGGLLGDFTIYKVVKDDLIKELAPVYKKFGGEIVTKFFKQKRLKWAVAVLGAVIVASPLPDELGISLMGIGGVKTKNFLFITFFLDIIGVFILLTAFSFLR